jgi:hypothetical protein
MRAVRLFAFAILGALFSMSASAATVTCSGAGTATVAIDISSAVGSSCLTTGNGNVLDGSSDPVNDLGYLTLDATHTLIPLVVPLTFTGVGATSGSFSFTADPLYEHYVLGFQAFTAAPNPDYFAFALADLIVSGTWLLSSGDNTITRAILYGQLAQNEITPVPLPGAVLLFGSALLGFFGFSRARKRLQIPATA